MMSRISTTWRMSFGLALLTISVVFAADLVGLIPDKSEAVLEGRKQLCESLAIQSAVCIERNDLAAVQATMQLVADRNEDILSAGLQTVDGKVLARTGDYVEGPSENSEMESVPTRVLVPIFMGAERWGTMKICFHEVTPEGIGRLWTGPIVRIALFVGLVGFVAYLWFLKRTLRYLDPNSVVPKRVKAALDTLIEGVVLLDKDERIVLANSAFARNVGRPEASLLGQKAECLNWRSSATGQTSDVLPWTAALRDGQVQTAVPLEFVGRPDNIRKLMVNAAAICDEHNDKRGTIATFDDVTKLEEQSVQLQEMLRLKDNLTNMIIHDMASPIQSIGMALDVALNDESDQDHESTDVLSHALDASRNLTEMVDSMLDISRMESGQMPLRLRSIELRHLAEEASGGLQFLANVESIRVTVQGSEVPLYADADLIRRVFVNLIGNALKFTPKGGEVTISVSVSDGWVRAEVHDNGCGIPEQYHERIFDKFGQAECCRDERKHSTGLGLTFCKLAVVAHGGNIGVQSHPGRGSTFWFSLPMTNDRIPIRA